MVIGLLSNNHNGEEMTEYKMSFWNYQKIGTKDFKLAIQDWKKIGFNYPISFRYDSTVSDKNLMLEFLDECKKNDLKVFLDDVRLYFWNYINKGENAYRNNVKQVVDDFGRHPAVYGFLIGDEPNREHMENVIPKVFDILYEEAPDLHHYLNLLPYWGEKDESFFQKFNIQKRDEYIEIISNMVKQAQCRSVSYDYYGQCCYFDREYYKDIVFHNLRMYGQIAQENQIELFSCPLSVGHMSTRIPNEDEIRWQISIMAAHGVTGFFWFFLYQGNYSSDFRGAPYDEYGEQTETYNFLKRQIRTFMDNHVKILSKYKFLWAKHLNKCYGGIEEFEGDTELISVKTEINHAPLIISKFVNEEETLYAITNNSVEAPTYVEIKWGGKWGDGKIKWWIAPGQMRLISNKCML